MALPELNAAGDLPPGVYPTTMTALTTRFGGPSRQRAVVTGRLHRAYRLARQTGYLDRFFVFGSYITARDAPNDVDVVLVMADDFRLAACPAEAQLLFHHVAAQDQLGVSAFWIRPAMLMQESVESFINHWQHKRDGSLRGIVEVIA